MAFQTPKEKKDPVPSSSFQPYQFFPINHTTTSSHSHDFSENNSKETSIDLECSLFMDETSADLENYLSTTIPECSQAYSEHYEDFECKTMNNLSQNIKGKYQKTYRVSKKNNKFFKSKLTSEKGSIHQNEIPVINEVMRKIFKPLMGKPEMKYSPKTLLKTYSNKHKDGATHVVESFGLPDEPLVPVVDPYAREQDSIDLDVQQDDFNDSLLVSPWTVPSQTGSTELTLGEEFRRSSCLFQDISPFVGDSLEDEVKEGFNFEENTEVNVLPKPEEKLWRKSSNMNHLEPKIFLKPIDLNDSRMLKMNKLSPMKNKRDLLYERLKNYSKTIDDLEKKFVSEDAVLSETTHRSVGSNQRSPTKGISYGKKEKMKSPKTFFNASKSNKELVNNSGRLTKVNSSIQKITTSDPINNSDSVSKTDRENLENKLKNLNETLPPSKDRGKRNHTSCIKIDEKKTTYNKMNHTEDILVLTKNDCLLSPKRVTRQSDHDLIAETLSNTSILNAVNTAIEYKKRKSAGRKRNEVLKEKKLQSIESEYKDNKKQSSCVNTTDRMISNSHTYESSIQRSNLRKSSNHTAKVDNTTSDSLNHELIGSSTDSASEDTEKRSERPSVSIETIVISKRNQGRGLKKSKKLKTRITKYSSKYREGHEMIGSEENLLTKSVVSLNEVQIEQAKYSINEEDSESRNTNLRITRSRVVEVNTSEKHKAMNGSSAKNSTNSEAYKQACSLAVSSLSAEGSNSDRVSKSTLKEVGEEKMQGDIDHQIYLTKIVNLKRCSGRLNPNSNIINHIDSDTTEKDGEIANTRITPKNNEIRSDEPNFALSKINLNQNSQEDLSPSKPLNYASNGFATIMNFESVESENAKLSQTFELCSKDVPDNSNLEFENSTAINDETCEEEPVSRGKSNSVKINGQMSSKNKQGKPLEQKCPRNVNIGSGTNHDVDKACVILRNVQEVDRFNKSNINGQTSSKRPRGRPRKKGLNFTNQLTEEVDQNSSEIAGNADHGNLEKFNGSKRNSMLTLSKMMSPITRRSRSYSKKHGNEYEDDTSNKEKTDSEGGLKFKDKGGKRMSVGALSTTRSDVETRDVQNKKINDALTICNETKHRKDLEREKFLQINIESRNSQSLVNQQERATIGQVDEQNYGEPSVKLNSSKKSLTQELAHLETNDEGHSNQEEGRRGRSRTKKIAEDTERALALAEDQQKPVGINTRSYRVTNSILDSDNSTVISKKEELNSLEKHLRKGNKSSIRVSSVDLDVSLSPKQIDREVVINERNVNRRGRSKSCTKKQEEESAKVGISNSQKEDKSSPVPPTLNAEAKFFALKGNLSISPEKIPSETTTHSRNIGGTVSVNPVLHDPNTEPLIMPEEPGNSELENLQKTSCKPVNLKQEDSFTPKRNEGIIMNYINNERSSHTKILNVDCSAKVSEDHNKHTEALNDVPHPTVEEHLCKDKDNLEFLDQIEITDGENTDSNNIEKNNSVITCHHQNILKNRDSSTDDNHFEIIQEDSVMAEVPELEETLSQQEKSAKNLGNQMKIEMESSRKHTENIAADLVSYPHQNVTTNIVHEVNEVQLTPEDEQHNSINETYPDLSLVEITNETTLGVPDLTNSDKRGNKETNHMLRKMQDSPESVLNSVSTSNSSNDKCDQMKNENNENLKSEEYTIDKKDFHQAEAKVEVNSEKFSGSTEKVYNAQISLELKSSKISITEEISQSKKDKIVDNQDQNNRKDLVAEYLDVGYDIHRRTSFRKILERVMEISKVEMETSQKTSRLPRCKSVPHEECSSKDSLMPKSASVDSKSKYLKNEPLGTNEIDIGRVKKRLEYSESNIEKLQRKIQNRVKSCHEIEKGKETDRVKRINEKGRSKSVLGINLDMSETNVQSIRNEKKNKRMMLSQKSESKPKGETETLNIAEKMKLTSVLTTCSDAQVNITPKCEKSISVAGNNVEGITPIEGSILKILLCQENSQKSKPELLDEVDLEIEAAQLSDDNLGLLGRFNRRRNKSFSEGCFAKRNSQKSKPELLDEVDLEVEAAQLSDDNLGLLERFNRRRNKSFSEGSFVKKNELRRSQSVTGKSKKMSRKDNRRLRRKTPLDKSFRELYGDADSDASPVHSKAAKKVLYEFKVGDSIWGKVGNYPYWPCLIVLDPETSEFKKYKLLRTTPYYHVRFFGDNGKRAWTTHVIPYEGPDDLEQLAKKCWRQGVQTSYIKEYYCVKPAQSEKWKKAVAEAESIKDEKVDRKIAFFNRIIATEKIKHISAEDSEIIDSSEPKHQDMLNTELGKTYTPKNYTVDNKAKSQETKKSPSPKRKRKMKESSVHSCIEDVVTKYCSSDDEDKRSQKSNVSATYRKKERRGNKQRERKQTPDEYEFDLGMELASLSEIPPFGSPKCDITASDKNVNNTPQGSARLASKSPKGIENLRTPKDSIQKLEFQTPSRRVRRNSVHNITISPPKLRERKVTQPADQSDCESKASDTSFIQSGVSQLSQSKKNLFKGVPREKVCQICEKPVDVIKCRAVCNGDYHVKCVDKSAQLTEAENKLKEESQDLQSLNGGQANEQVQIITVSSRKKLLPDTLSLSPSSTKMPLTEQIDRKMQEIMNHVVSQNLYNSELTESTDSGGEETNCKIKLENQLVNKSTTKELNNKNVSKSRKSREVFKHVTADDETVINISEEHTSLHNGTSEVNDAEESVYKCAYCTSSIIPPCFVCNAVISKKGNTMRQRCSYQKCGRYYHLECLNIWPQTQWSFILHEKRKSEAFDSFVCPRHVCHICASENLGCSIGRCPNDKLVKCLRCPATYHNSYHCVPAGTQILTSTQVICPRHLQQRKSCTSNTVWCFVCSEGGHLICCENCPTSVHAECLQVNLMDDDTYICEDCESGRFPLYDEVVWVKCGSFRWWPAIILFPSEVPPNVEAKPHAKGDFVVKFFGTYDYYWVGRGRTFLYQEGDTGCLNSSRNKIDEAFSRALKEAADVYCFKKESKSKRDMEVNNGLKPPSYVRIKVNRPVGNVRVFEGNLSNTTSCDCNPHDKNPCGPNSNCLNRLLLTECDPDVCPAGNTCKNQCFEKRKYPQMIPYRTPSRGWGLKTLESLNKGQFVIEYVGEIIDDEEYQRRIKRMHQQKDENYYFLTIDTNRTLDAGPKGNAARFMNHSCQPNCETQKWTVNGDTRVGLFAIDDIAAGTELTFNYNLECIGKEKKICRCEAPNCSGYIGVKPDDQKLPKQIRKEKKKTPENIKVVNNDPCFMCGKKGDVRMCTNKLCLKSYHLQCVQLDSWPQGKWTCPSHNCNICSRRTIRSCVQCTNSFCPVHSSGNVRHDSLLGFVCSLHDPMKKFKRTKRKFGNSIGEETKILPSPSSLRSKRYQKRSDSNIGIEPSPKKKKF